MEKVERGVDVVAPHRLDQTDDWLYHLPHPQAMHRSRVRAEVWMELDRVLAGVCEHPERKRDDHPLGDDRGDDVADLTVDPHAMHAPVDRPYDVAIDDATTLGANVIEQEVCERSVAAADTCHRGAVGTDRAAAVLDDTRDADLAERSAVVALDQVLEQTAVVVGKPLPREEVASRHVTRGRWRLGHQLAKPRPQARLLDKQTVPNGVVDVVNPFATGAGRAQEVERDVGIAVHELGPELGR